MVQAQFNLDESLWTFVQQSWQYGFQTQDELIRVALGKLQQELYSLEMSADLYAEVYAEDADLQALTDSAIAGWTEWIVYSVGRLLMLIWNRREALKRGKFG